MEPSNYLDDGGNFVVNVVGSDNNQGFFFSLEIFEYYHLFLSSVFLLLSLITTV